MIPKIIHYCWFGPEAMPRLVEKCIASWHEHMPEPEWTYKLWNEQNFDISSHPYVQEAYEAGKYAFVTDYVRLWVLLHEGGIYMDTDVEVFRPYDDTLLQLRAFTGYEGSKHHPPVTGTVASEAGGIWVAEQLHEYDGLHFLQKDGTPDLTTNTTRITAAMERGGFVSDGKRQVYRDMTIFPVDYFCPRQTTGELLITDHTYCDHHFMASWDERQRSWLYRLIGPAHMTRLIKLKRRLVG
ncbi:MAG: glycosyl transferase [Bacteroidales bacterium]|nr:glycosyl transferase [Bacteroidales bacterium]